MQKTKHNQFVYSASDLVNFLLCPSIIKYDIQNLEKPLKKAEDDEYSKILQQKGFEHEKNYLSELKNKFTNVIDIEEISHNSRQQALENTLSAMSQGVDIIFQAFFQVDNRIGHVDFLKKVEKPSKFGNYSYEVIDTKLANNAKPKFIIQLCFYSDLLQYFQGTVPDYIHLKFGNGRQKSFYLQDYYSYYKTVKFRFDDFLINQDNHKPVPCDHCGYCSWRLLCSDKWVREDNLSQVANISKSQIKKLEKYGITTLKALGTALGTIKIPKIHSLILNSLRKQASLQLKKRTTGENYFELLPFIPGSIRGFNRLPPADNGDLYFDMEGDPLEEGGLEYLFGIYYLKTGKPVFKDFWAHDKKQEKDAFEAFIDFIWKHLKEYPDAHIYHYAHYEETALKKLMSLHGTREYQVDELLRNHKLIDLYKVVREGLRISESSYSIKKLENFYMEKRQADVVNAVDSIIYYEKWKSTKDQAILQSIRDYNEDDCRSTFLLHKWLLSIKPESAKYFYDLEIDSIQEIDDGIVSEHEILLEQVLEILIRNLPQNKKNWNSDDKLCCLTGYLLDFYRRSDKPAWWSIFSRMEMTKEELIDDGECIGGLTSLCPPEIKKRSFVYTYNFPEQEFKLREGQNCTRTDTGESLSKIIHLDTEKNIIQFKIGMTREQPPEKLSIGAGYPINNKILKAALFRFAGSMINDTSQYQAIKQILKKDFLTIKGISSGNKIIDITKDIISESVRVVKKLDNSYLSIQGPPGTGKTYIAVRIILELLKAGKRIGISSNSHKAINNLLSGIEEYAIEQEVIFSGTKKCTAQNEDSYLNGKIIKDVTKNGDVLDDLVGATAWYFAREENDQLFDYLFIDEAGQVSLANIVAMGLCAKNIILLGDQMQLGQPIQGTHPEDSGKSVLDFLMAEYSTVPENRGIFLPKTYRIHPDLSNFISEVSYDGRLVTDNKNINQHLILQNDQAFILPPTGLKFIPVDHDACSQYSIEETHTIKQIIDYLLKQSYCNKTGEINPIALDNILIVAPYNMQVNLLRKELPDGTRVGTVDKFQGQEAEIVIISMTTSNQEYLPKFIDFLFSKKRLNVALSRAKCLAIMVANPQLLNVQCNTVEQMGLVNTLCRAYYTGIV